MTEHMLMVCTANQCRSPLGAALLAAASARRGIDLTVSSAGIAAVPGIAATPATITAGRALGVDLGDHQSRALSGALIGEADVIIGMERRHVQEIVLAEPRAFPRAFTLRELVRRGAENGPRAPGEDVSAWLMRAHADRRPSDLLGLSRLDDVADPTGNPLADHRSLAEELAALNAALLDLLYPAGA